VRQSHALLMRFSIHVFGAWAPVARIVLNQTAEAWADGATNRMHLGGSVVSMSVSVAGQVMAYICAIPSPVIEPAMSERAVKDPLLPSVVQRLLNS
jgi:hypothetical protein